MKNLILGLVLILTISSCQGGYSLYQRDGLVMIGNKPYKVVNIEVDRQWVTCLVPSDSSVSVIPPNTSYHSGKTIQNTVIIPYETK